MWTNYHSNKANLDLKERKNKTYRVQKTKNIGYLHQQVDMECKLKHYKIVLSCKCLFFLKTCKARLQH